MKFRSFLAVAAASAFSTIASVGNAATYTYSMNNIVYGDGATLTGSFSFDDTTETFFDVSATLSGTTSFTNSGSGEAYDGVYDGATLLEPEVVIFYRIATGETVFSARTGFLVEDTFASLVGGTTAVTFAAYGSSFDGNINEGFDEIQPNYFESPVTGASISGVSVVPLPPSLPLLAFGLGGLAYVSRRKRKSAGLRVTG